MWSHSASHKFLSFQSSYIRHWLGGSSQGPLSSPFSTNLWKLCCCFEPPLWLLWGRGGLLELQFIVRSFSHLTSFSFSACSLNFFHLLPIWTLRGMQTATISHMLKVVHENMWETVQIPLAIQCDMQLLLLLSPKCEYLISLHHQITAQWSILWSIWLLKRVFTPIWIGQ